MTRFIFVTGGVVSSLGKGITTAALAVMLEKRGLKVSIQKLDPYINVDPGTMSPFEHGEVYVTEDGYEADLDLGHYERFSQAPIGRHSNATTGSTIGWSGSHLADVGLPRLPSTDTCSASNAWVCCAIVAACSSTIESSTSRCPADAGSTPTAASFSR